MTTLYRVRTLWTGFPGAPGYTTMYALDIGTFLDELATFWASVAGLLPGDVTVTIPRTGDRIEDTTGDLIGSWTETGTEFATAGSNGEAYAAPVGAVIDWATD